MFGIPNYTNWKFKFKFDLLNALALMWNRMENQVLKNEFTLSYLIYLNCNQRIMLASLKVIPAHFWILYLYFSNK